MKSRTTIASVLAVVLPAAARAALAPTTQPAASQPAGCEYACKEHNLCFRYPPTWVPRTGGTAMFQVVAPPGGQQLQAELSLDVPHLPPHFAWMISAKRVEDGYVKNLRGSTIPDAKVTALSPVSVNGCQQALRVRCDGDGPNKQPMCDVAVIAIRDGAVYIFSCDSNPAGDQQAWAALDGAIATVRWTK